MFEMSKRIPTGRPRKMPVLRIQDNSQDTPAFQEKGNCKVIIMVTEPRPRDYLTVKKLDGNGPPVEVVYIMGIVDSKKEGTAEFSMTMSRAESSVESIYPRHSFRISYGKPENPPVPVDVHDANEFPKK